MFYENHSKKGRLKYNHNLVRGLTIQKGMKVICMQQKKSILTTGNVHTHIKIQTI